MSDSRGVGGGSGWGDLTGYQRVSGAAGGADLNRRPHYRGGVIGRVTILWARVIPALVKRSIRLSYRQADSSVTQGSSSMWNG